MPSNKKIGILITARMGSSRLPQKHILDMGGVSPIVVLIRRLKQSGFPIVIATGNKEENVDFLKIAEEEGVEVYFGSPKNIPLRHLQACRSFAFDFAISVDGDDILTSPEAVGMIVNRYLMFGDESKYYHTSGLPFGINCGGYSQFYLDKVLKNLEKDVVLETGWGRIFSKESFENILVESKNAENWRLSLDYEEDFEVFKALWLLHKEKLIEMTTAEILKSFEENQFYKINENVVTLYWENFNSELLREKKNE